MTITLRRRTATLVAAPVAAALLFAPAAWAQDTDVELCADLAAADVTIVDDLTVELQTRVALAVPTPPGISAGTSIGVVLDVLGCAADPEPEPTVDPTPTSDPEPDPVEPDPTAIPEPTSPVDPEPTTGASLSPQPSTPNDDAPFQWANCDAARAAGAAPVYVTDRGFHDGLDANSNGIGCEDVDGGKLYNPVLNGETAGDYSQTSIVPSGAAETGQM
ncbi:MULTISPECIES: excalibur calcium-binding domain-containing protein [Pseudonocardia]|uniref:Excalibur calcium-binding domain-containing protein n=2 Tax=Pseudonocardia TaxID=1847 RepID=A0A1Y2N6Y5_PSEAH|nr:MULTISPECIES: excalibur calcium-binding domain-containing protein [Pseudonocardia]OSY42941.1 hypothetical protein BG845_01183 [Pseudonocardia autotrophica]TDN77517.1 excalibur calcium-binding domain-containing protein [Pseudonocardia autotrophica]BBG01542.1 hypothetical protein Pdca_27510 [Pseudonocardia autotrophica]GEC25326.1 hypothetical protein PSA01_23550 [Pseudonocardia saturnea]